MQRLSAAGGLEAGSELQGLLGMPPVGAGAAGLSPAAPSASAAAAPSGSASGGSGLEAEAQWHEEKRLLKAICKLALAVTMDQVGGRQEAAALADELAPLMAAHAPALQQLGLHKVWASLHRLAQAGGGTASRGTPSQASGPPPQAQQPAQQPAAVAQADQAVQLPQDVWALQQRVRQYKAKCKELKVGRDGVGPGWGRSAAGWGCSSRSRIWGFRCKEGCTAALALVRPQHHDKPPHPIPAGHCGGDGGRSCALAGAGGRGGAGPGAAALQVRPMGRRPSLQCLHRRGALLARLFEVTHCLSPVPTPPRPLHRPCPTAAPAPPPCTPRPCPQAGGPAVRGEVGAGGLLGQRGGRRRRVGVGAGWLARHGQAGAGRYADGMARHMDMAACLHPAHTTVAPAFPLPECAHFTRPLPPLQRRRALEHAAERSCGGAQPGPAPHPAQGGRLGRCIACPCCPGRGARCATLEPLAACPAAWIGTHPAPCVCFNSCPFALPHLQYRTLSSHLHAAREGSQRRQQQEEGPQHGGGGAASGGSSGGWEIRAARRDGAHVGQGTASEAMAEAGRKAAAIAEKLDRLLTPQSRAAVHGGFAGGAPKGSRFAAEAAAAGEDGAAAWHGDAAQQELWALAAGEAAGAEDVPLRQRFGSAGGGSSRGL